MRTVTYGAACSLDGFIAAPLLRDPGHRVALELSECRTLDGGCVLATYRVRHPG